MQCGEGQAAPPPPPPGFSQSVSQKGGLGDGNIGHLEHFSTPSPLLVTTKIGFLSRERAYAQHLE